MQKRIEVMKYSQTARTLELEGNGPVFDESLLASGQMLVDSDAVAFIYKLENKDEFVYLSLPFELWPSLKLVMDAKLDVVLRLENQHIVLSNIIEELHYLVSNIEGNTNYGDEMVSKVEEIFLQVKN